MQLVHTNIRRGVLHSSMRQIKVNKPGKLSAPPNLPIFLGQEPVPSTQGSIDQWLFQVDGALATHTEEVIGSEEQLKSC